MIQISDLAVISSLHNFGQLWIDGLCPDGISHVRNFFIQLIFFHLAENKLWHSIGIVHSIEWNGRSQRRMRTYERDEPEKRARVTRLCDLLYCAISHPPFAS